MQPTLTSLPLVEVCLESVEDVLAAEAGGADRAELCANLVEGGTTPSSGTIRLAKERARIPIMVMIRPRGGDFLYSDVEMDVMRSDIEAAKRDGADGVVFGCLRQDGTIDEHRTRDLVEAARPMPVTFHRAFDMSRDPLQSLETLIELGVDRVLTSGQESAVPLGLSLLRDLVQRAGDRIIVMPGAGIEADNIREVAAVTGAKELHFAAFCKTESGMSFRNPRPAMSAGPAPGEFELQSTDRDLVARFVQALRG